MPGREILAAPVRFDVVKDGKALTWKTTRAARCRAEVLRARRCFSRVQAAPGLTRRTDVTVEMDGRVGVRIALEARRGRRRWTGCA